MNLAIHNATVKGFEIKTIFRTMNNKYITWAVKPTIFMIPICSSNLLILKSSISSVVLFVLSILEYIRQIITDWSIDGCKTSSGTYFIGRLMIAKCHVANISYIFRERTSSPIYKNIYTNERMRQPWQRRLNPTKCLESM